MNLTRALRIQGWMEPDELHWLAEMARNCQRIVEIGTWKGRSARAMLDNSKAMLYAVDCWQQPYEPADGTGAELRERGGDEIRSDWARNLSDHIATGRVHLTLGKSRDVVPQVWGALGRQAVDLLFIDADHSYEGCLDDIALYRGMVRPGGVIAGHDYTTEVHPGVKHAVDAYFGSTAWQGPGSIWFAAR